MPHHLLLVSLATLLATLLLLAILLLLATHLPLLELLIPFLALMVEFTLLSIATLASTMDIIRIVALLFPMCLVLVVKTPLLLPLLLLLPLPRSLLLCKPFLHNWLLNARLRELPKKLLNRKCAQTTNKSLLMLDVWRMRIASEDHSLVTSLSLWIANLILCRTN
jgi:hypothetical protein